MEKAIVLFRLICTGRLTLSLPAAETLIKKARVIKKVKPEVCFYDLPTM